ncbi:ROK family protein [Acidithrix sp. C25]|uniref:ROK family protein n=1 Tax=Acidithrix sp. C25 TaxID=1671482 RepID=UPI00191BC7C1|nr:ROK family protein [Acidithrix sp. C25]
MLSFRVGFDLGGTKLAGVLVDQNLKPVASCFVPAPTHGQWLGEAMMDVIGRLCMTAKIVPGQIEAVGAGLPALIAPGGAIQSCAHLPSLVGMDIQNEIQSAGRWRVHLENDVNCAAVTAMANHGSSFLLLTIGTGIGGALVEDGNLRRGFRGFAGEFGHMVIAVGGDQCVCGKRGCAEVYASGSFLASRARRAMEQGRLNEIPDDADATSITWTKRIFEIAATNLVANRIVEEFCSYLAVVISNLIEATDAKMVLIGGGVSASFDLFEEKLNHAYLLAMPSDRLRQDIVFQAIEFGPLAGAIGAAAIA